MENSRKKKINMKKDLLKVLENNEFEEIEISSIEEYEILEKIVYVYGISKLETSIYDNFCNKDLVKSLLENNDVVYYNSNTKQWGTSKTTLIPLNINDLYINNDQSKYIKSLEGLEFDELILLGSRLFKITELNENECKMISEDTNDDYTLHFPFCIDGTAILVKDFIKKESDLPTIIEKNKNNEIQSKIDLINIYIEQRTKEINNTKNRIEALSRQVIDLEKDVKKETEKIEKLKEEKNSTINTEDILEKLEFIKSFNKVKNVEITDSGILVSTTHLNIFEPEEERLFSLGEMLLYIPFNKEQEVRFYNTTTRRDGYETCMNHPHIWKNGTACIGNAGSLISIYRNDDNYALVVIAMINFCESVNIFDAAGNYIRAWDEINEDGDIIEEGYPNKQYSSMYECEICGADGSEENMHYCECCERYVCDDCWYREEEVCRDCFNNYYSACDECGAAVWNDDMYEVEGDLLCEECFNEKCGYCIECDEPHYIDNMIMIGGFYYCREHAPEGDE